LYRWISAILQIKHPSGIWTNLRDAERRMTRIVSREILQLENSIFSLQLTQKLFLAPIEDTP